MGQTNHKVINKSGGLTIPASVRREHNNFFAGEAVDINVEDGKLIIAPHAPRCIFCSSIDEVFQYAGKNICKACVSSLWKEANISE